MNFFWNGIQCPFGFDPTQPLGGHPIAISGWLQKKGMRSGFKNSNGSVKSFVKFNPDHNSSIKPTKIHKNQKYFPTKIKPRNLDKKNVWQHLFWSQILTKKLFENNILKWPTLFQHSKKKKDSIWKVIKVSLTFELSRTKRNEWADVLQKRRNPLLQKKPPQTWCEWDPLMIRGIELCVVF